VDWIYVDYNMFVEGFPEYAYYLLGSIKSAKFVG
jgi:hypothetical protein